MWVLESFMESDGEERFRNLLKKLGVRLFLIRFGEVQFHEEIEYE